MPPSPAPRELIIVAKSEVDPAKVAADLNSMISDSTLSLSAMPAAENVRFEPVFGLSEHLVNRRFQNAVSDFSEGSSIPSRFYKVSAPDANLDDLARRLYKLEWIDAAFVKPGVELPLMTSGRTFNPQTPPLVTPDLEADQAYLDQRGVNAIVAWNFPGADGRGVRIVDVEGAWRFTHEDLKENQGGVAGGTVTPEALWRNHGTAVLGMLSGDRNAGHNFGIVGICPEANVRGVSVFGQPTSNVPFDSGTAAAIRQAADLLSAGDIMVIELQSPGPPDFEVREDQRGYIPIEWWPDNFNAVRYAVDKGVIVVEAAGNGSRNLDDDIFEHHPKSPFGPFPADWKNPFRRANADSGVILVGAGAPAVFNGIDLGPERSRMQTSNFGDRLDAQGWGQQVTTTGFGNLQEGEDEDRWYTPDFGGTSAAAPMVAGALACVQSALSTAGKPRLNPLEARQLLEKTGLPQVDGADNNFPKTEKIGNRPDIVAMLKSKGIFPP